MHHIHTHYDNLQLPQSATDTEIRQAYRRLSKKYHPDLSNDPDAHRIMQIVNRAYEVLSNPQTRAEHDKWIALQYLQQQQVHIQAQSITYYSEEDEEDSPEPPYPHHDDDLHHSSHQRLLWGLLAISVVLSGLIVWQGWGWLERYQILSLIMDTPPIAYEDKPLYHNTNTNNIALQNQSYNQETIGNSEHYTRPQTAPNGSPFPEDSGYIAGYPVIVGMGTSKLIIENVRNSSDVFAQLYEKNNPNPLRTFFLVEREQMTLPQLDAGDYFVRYYQLDDGEHLDSEIISLVRNQSATIYLQRGKAPVYYNE